MKPTKLLIETDGAITMIYTDEAAELVEEGTVTITRASNVEPGPVGGWVADMVAGPALGPFRLRADALAAEVQFLEDKLFS